MPATKIRQREAMAIHVVVWTCLIRLYFPEHVLSVNDDGFTVPSFGVV